MVIKNSLLTVLILLSATQVICDEVVRFDVQIGMNTYEVDIQLFDNITPNTVQNFLNYVDVNPRYDGTFIHRSIPDFVIQGGGFVFEPTSGTFDSGGVRGIVVDPAIDNEFQGSGLSNVRGTISMAKLSGQPDSATSQWFINLVDNSANLDVQNGGSTVFGRVTDDGMTVIDQVEATAVFDKSGVASAFSTIPLDNYTNPDPVQLENLIRINTARHIQRPIIETDVSSLDFGLLQTGLTSTATVTLQNVGNADLMMAAGSIAFDSGPFSLTADTCTGITLVAESGVSCSLTVQFEPTIVGVFDSTLQITPVVNPNNVTLTVDIIAEAVPVVPVLHVVDATSSIDFGDVPTNTTVDDQLIIQNKGGGILSFASLLISGANSSEFSMGTGCSITTNLMIGETCTLSVSVTPTVEGSKTAELSIVANNGAGSYMVDLIALALGPEIDLETSLDVGFTPLNVEKVTGYFINNIGEAALSITSLNLSGSSDFVIIDNTCPDVATTTVQPLDPPDLFNNSTCTVIIGFTPTTAGLKTATLSIGSTDLDEPLIDVSLTGNVGEPIIDIAITDLDVGISSVNGVPAINQFEVFNRGPAPLEFTALNLSGIDVADYSVASNCPGVSTIAIPLEQNESCTIAIQLIATQLGIRNGLLEVVSNDLNAPSVFVGLVGFGDDDTDGVPISVEQASPNSGDGNNDTIQDGLQSNVVSFVTSAGSYATMVAPSGIVFSELMFPNASSITNPPASIQLTHGLMGTNVSVATGSTLRLFVYLPLGDKANLLYKFGPTPDDPLPHWYDFRSDGISGASHFKDVSIEIPGGGSPINRSVFIIDFVDGGRGDDDLTADGVITNSYFSFSTPAGIETNDGSGTFSLLYSLLLFIIIAGFRCYRCQGHVA